MLRLFGTIIAFTLAVKGDPVPAISQWDTKNSIDIGYRIKGGDEAPPETYLFVVSILDKGFHRCGGSIISKSVILTAAHCIDDSNPWDFTVRVGSLRMDSGGTIYPVEDFVRPKEYHTDSFSTKLDVALLKLQSALPTDGKIRPVKLYWPNEQIYEGTLVTSVGWGWTYNGEEDRLKTLRHVKFPLLSADKCANQLRSHLGVMGQICAGAPGKAACPGDSGGPLLLGDRQIGIASVSFGCRNAMRPTVYTDVTYFRNWIEHNLWNLAGEVVNEWDVRSSIHFPGQ